MPNDALTADALTTELVMLELELQSAEARANAHRLAQLLHPSFTEFTRSGLPRSRVDTLALLLQEAPPAHPHAQDFQLRSLGPDLAMLTYQSARFGAEGRFDAHALHCSLWQRDDSGWRLMFHQATPAPGFVEWPA